MYAATLKSRAEALEQKLAATEKLLELEKADHAQTKRVAADWKASHALQQVNTGAFWQGMRDLEKKIQRIAELIEQYDDHELLKKQMLAVVQGE